MIDPPARDVVAARLAEVEARIAAAGGAGRTRVLPVTKAFGPEAVRTAAALGCRAVGESYVQEVAAKRAELGDDADALDWVFIGRLQTNKVRHLVGLVAEVHSVDRVSLVDELARRCPGLAVLIQLNLSDEPQKGGCDPSEAADLVARARDAGLDVRGLMGVGPAGDPELARPGFRSLVALADRLGLPERSIGMSADLEVAVSEGATEVRIGSGLFGPR